MDDIRMYQGSIPDDAIAQRLGISVPALNRWRDKPLTQRKIICAIMAIKKNRA